MSFPDKFVVEYQKLDDFTFPILKHVCKPRGTDKTWDFFVAHCSKCKQRLNEEGLVMSACSIVSGLGRHATNCPHCGSSTLVATLKDLTDEDKERLRNDKFFYQILNAQNIQNSHASVDAKSGKDSMIENWNVLEREDYGFRIVYPLDWFKEYTDQGIEILPNKNPTVFDPELGCNVASPGVNITIKQVPDNIDDAVSQLVEILPKSYKQMNKSYRHIDSYECNIPNATYGHYYEFQYSVGQTIFSCLSLVVQRGKVLYYLTAPGSCADYHNWRDTITNILGSFKLIE